MPPGQFYARYAGLLAYEEIGTFLRYDTMHLSEWSLFLDNSHGKMYTGQERKGTFVTLRRMMAALPYMPLSLSELLLHFIYPRPQRFPHE
jgi:hypothetical protein